MTTYHDLLHAILADYSDDTPRLVMADWLEENGELERAEFIRVQMELARLSPNRHPWCGCDECRLRGKLKRRERDLLSLDFVLPLARALGVSEKPGQHKGNRYRFIGTQCLCWGEGGPSLMMVWKRGFIEEVSCLTDRWLQHGQAIVALHPIQQVTLQGDFEWRVETPALLNGIYPHVTFFRQSEISEEGTLPLATPPPLTKEKSTDWTRRWLLQQGVGGFDDY